MYILGLLISNNHKWNFLRNRNFVLDAVLFTCLSSFVKQKKTGLLSFNPLTKVFLDIYTFCCLKTNNWNVLWKIGSLGLCTYSAFSYVITNKELSRCASCVARCIPPCDSCAYFRNPQGQTISSWILVYLCVCPTISTALKVFGPKKY